MNTSTGTAMSRAEFEQALRRKGQYYHIHHPYHRAMYEGRCTPEQIRGWVANRYYYQIMIPQKDAAILANCPDPQVRRQWVQRILDHDGHGDDAGGIEAWLALAEAVGLSREEVIDQRHVLPGVRFAVDAYVRFARTASWQEAACSSLTELFAPDIHQSRLDSWPQHYPWIDERGSRHSVVNFASNFGARHVLLVSDPGVEAAGWVTDIAELLQGADIRTTVFTGVSPNPRVDEVMAGAEIYRAGDCDVIVAIGGGSPMDCAKGIGIVASHGRHILEFEGVDTITNPPPPLILIPTTAGTSADVSQFAIISDPARRFKFSIISKAVVPDVSLIDPEVTQTMDPFLTACTGVDALVHAIEAFVSTGAGPLTDSHALEAIRLINRHLEPLVADTSNARLREQVMLASMQAGLAFSNAILGAVHAMSHSLGGFLDLPHGLCNALLLEHVVAYSFPSAEERFRLVAEAMGTDTRGMAGSEVKKRLMARIMELKQRVGLEARLSQLGVTTSDIPYLSGYAMKDPCILTNPRKSSLRDVQVVYEEAL